MPQLFTNNARSRLTSAIAPGDTSLVVEPANADLFPTANTGTGTVPAVTNWFKATLQNSSGAVEIVYVRTRTSGSAIFSNVIRGQDGTTAIAFDAGTVVGLRLTAQDIESVIFTAGNSVGLTGDQTIDGVKTFSSPIEADINGSVSGNASTVSNGVYTVTDQTIAGTKTFTQPVVADITGNAATANNATTAVTATTAGNGLPTGSIFDFAGNTAPPGSLRANGAGTLVSLYPELTAAIYCGDASNATAPSRYRANNPDGTGRNTVGAYLILPDERSRFRRGWDDGRGIDTGRVLGSFQADDFKSHAHSTPTYLGATNGAQIAGSANGSYFQNQATTAVGGAETRPPNTAWLVCIKF